VARLESIRLRRTDHDMPKWQERIFTGLAHNSGSPAADFRLPAERTLSVATGIEI